jgi:hypothetical protein
MLMNWKQWKATRSQNNSNIPGVSNDLKKKKYVHYCGEEMAEMWLLKRVFSRSSWNVWQQMLAGTYTDTVTVVVG